MHAYEVTSQDVSVLDLEKDVGQIKRSTLKRRQRHQGCVNASKASKEKKMCSLHIELEEIVLQRV